MLIFQLSAREYSRRERRRRLQYWVERNEREVEFGGAERERQTDRERERERSAPQRLSQTLCNTLFQFILSPIASLATAMPSRRRTLLKVIILGDSGFVSSSFPFLGFLLHRSLHFSRFSTSFFALHSIILLRQFLLLPIGLYCGIFHVPVWIKRPLFPLLKSLSHLQLRLVDLLVTEFYHFYRLLVFISFEMIVWCFCWCFAGWGRRLWWTSILRFCLDTPCFCLLLF